MFPCDGAWNRIQLLWQLRSSNFPKEMTFAATFAIASHRMTSYLFTLNSSLEDVFQIWFSAPTLVLFPRFLNIRADKTQYLRSPPAFHSVSPPPLVSDAEGGGCFGCMLSIATKYPIGARLFTEDFISHVTETVLFMETIFSLQHE